MAVVGLLAAACSMAESIPMGLPSPEPTLACKSNAGAYYLPRTVIKVAVYANVDDRRKDKQDFDVVLSRSVEADERFGFCLDYLASTTADDKINVKKIESSNLLAVVSTDAIDQSRYIVQTLIRSLFIAASGNPQFPGFGRAYTVDNNYSKYIIFQAEFDPFDPERTALINESLKTFGYCLMLGPFTVRASSAHISEYCDHPKATLRRLGALRPEYQMPAVPGNPPDRADAERRQFFRFPYTERSGIYYRPRVPYRLDLYRKANLKAEGNWRLRAAKQVPMENISPLVLAKVDRTFFAQRKTTLMFAAGMLERVCVYKQSEALQASYIPVQIVASVVALPTQVFQVRIDQTTHQAELAESQREVLKTQLHVLQLQAHNSNPEAKGSKVTPVFKGAATPGTDPDANNKYIPLSAGEGWRGGEVTEGVLADASVTTDWNTTCPTIEAHGLEDPVKTAIDKATVVPPQVVTGTPPAASETPQPPSRVP